MARLLINKNDFKEYKQVSKGKDVELIEQYIQEAQDIDLKEIVCREFYYDLLKNFQLSEYQKLIHGETYTDADGNVIEYKGIKAVLVYFAYARYILRGHITDTPFGVVQKTNEFSQPVSSAEKREVRDRSRIDAMLYWDEVKKYLDQHVQLFPKWKECEDCGCGGNKNKKIKISVL